MKKTSADAPGQPELFDEATLRNLAYLSEHPELLEDEPYARCA